MKRRCVNCGVFWTDGDGDVQGKGCVYHPGVYAAPAYLASRIAQNRRRWTCCQSFAEHAPGCCTSKAHVEDMETTATLAKVIPTPEKSPKPKPAPPTTEKLLETPPKIEPLPGYVAEELAAIEKEREEERAVLAAKYREKVERARVATAPPPSSGAGQHQVDPARDTMQGLALRYGTTVDTLRRMNGFSTDAELYTRIWINVPLPTPEEEEKKKPVEPKPNTPTEEQEAVLMKRGLVSQFLSRFPGKTDEEATTYLSIAKWDLEAAARAMKEDLAWEDQHSKDASVEADKRRRQRKGDGDLF
jgi:hypothetical protein